MNSFVDLVSKNKEWVFSGVGVFAIAAIVGIVRSAITRRKRLLPGQEVRRNRIFLSMQMSQLAPSEYERIREDIMNLVFELRKTDDVYFFNEFIPHLDAFDEKTVNPEEYLGHIRRCDYFIAIIPERVFSSIYFEAGYALAHGKNSYYFVLRKDVMPILMRLVSADHPKAKVIEADSLDEIALRITNTLSNVRRLD